MPPSMSAEDLQAQLEELIYKNNELEEQVEEWKAASQEKETILETITDEIAEFKETLEGEKEELVSRIKTLQERIAELEAIIYGNDKLKEKLENLDSEKGQGEVPSEDVLAEKDAEISHLKEQLRKTQAEQAEKMKRDLTQVHDSKEMVNELMKISLSAEAASKLMMLIGKNVDFDVEGISERMQKKSPEERQKELTNVLWDQVSELHTNNKQLQQDIGVKMTEIEDLQVELKQIEEKTVPIVKVEQLKQELDLVTKQTHEFEQELQAADGTIEKLKVDLVSNESTILELQQEKVGLKQNNDKLQEVKDTLQKMKIELSQELDQKKNELVQVNEEKDVLLSELVDPGSQQLSDALFETISRKLAEKGHNPDTMLNRSDRKLPSTGLINIPKELEDMKNSISVLKNVPQTDISNLIQIHSSFKPEQLEKMRKIQDKNADQFNKILNKMEPRDSQLGVKDLTAQGLLSEKDLKDIEKIVHGEAEHILAGMRHDPELMKLFAELCRNYPEQMSRLSSRELLSFADLNPTSHELVAKLLEMSDEVSLPNVKRFCKDNQMPDDLKIEVENLSKALKPSDMEKVLDLYAELTAEEFESLIRLASKHPESFSQLIQSQSLSSGLARNLLKLEALEPEQMKKLLGALSKIDPRMSEKLLSKLADDFQSDKHGKGALAQNLVRYLSNEDNLSAAQMTRLSELFADLSPEEFSKILDLLDENGDELRLNLSSENFQGQNIGKILRLKDDITNEELCEALKLCRTLDSGKFDKFMEKYRSDPEKVRQILSSAANEAQKLQTIFSENSDLTFDEMAIVPESKMSVEAGVNTDVPEADLSFEEQVVNLAGKILEDRNIESKITEMLKVLSAKISPSDFQMLLTLQSSLPKEEFLEILDLISLYPDIMSKLLRSADSDPSLMENFLDVKGSLDDEQTDCLMTLLSDQSGSDFAKILSQSAQELGDSELKGEVLKSMLGSVSKASDTAQISPISYAIRSVKPETLSNLHKSAKTFGSEVSDLCRLFPDSSKLAKLSSLNADTVESFVDLHKEYPNFADKLLDADSFDPAIIEKVIESYKNLTPEQFQELVKMSEGLTPTEFNMLIKLGEDDPKQFRRSLNANMSKDTPKSVVETIETKVKELGENDDVRDELLTKIRDFAVKAAPTDTDMLLQLKDHSNSVEFEAVLDLCSQNPTKISTILESATKDVKGIDNLKSELEGVKDEPFETRVSDLSVKMMTDSKVEPEVMEKLEAVSTKVPPKDFSLLLDLQRTLDPTDFEEVLELVSLQPEAMTKLLRSVDLDESVIENVLNVTRSLEANEAHCLIGSLASEEPSEISIIISRSSEHFKVGENEGAAFKSLLAQSAKQPKGNFPVPYLKIVTDLEPETLKALHVAADYFGADISEICQTFPDSGKLEKLSSMEPPQLESLVKLQKDNPKFAQNLLEGSSFAPNVSEQILKVHKTLPPRQFQDLVHLSEDLDPSEFQELVQLSESNPEKFRRAISSRTSKAYAKSVAETVQEKIEDVAEKHEITDDMLNKIKHFASVAAPTDTDKLIALRETLNAGDFTNLVNICNQNPEELSRVFHYAKPDTADKLLSIADASAEKQKQQFFEAIRVSENPQFAVESLASIPFKSKESLAFVLDTVENLPSKELDSSLKLVSSLKAETVETLAELHKESNAKLSKICKTFNEVELFDNLAELKTPQSQKIIELNEKHPEFVQKLLKSDYFEPDLIENLTELNSKISTQQFDALVEISAKKDKAEFKELINLIQSSPEQFEVLILGSSTEIESTFEETTKGKLEVIADQRHFSPEAAKSLISFGIVSSPTELDKLLKLQTVFEDDPKTFAQLMDLAGSDPKNVKLILASDNLEKETLVELLELRDAVLPNEFDDILQEKFSKDGRKSISLNSETLCEDTIAESLKEILRRKSIEPDLSEKLITAGARSSPKSLDKLFALEGELTKSDFNLLVDLFSAHPEEVKGFIEAPNCNIESVENLLEASKVLNSEQTASFLNLTQKSNPEAVVDFLEELKTDGSAGDKDREVEPKTLTDILSITDALGASETELFLPVSAKLSPEQLEKLSRLATSDPVCLNAMLSKSSKGGYSVEQLLNLCDPQSVDQFVDMSRHLSDLSADEIGVFISCLQSNPNSENRSEILKNAGNIIELKNKLGESDGMKLLEMATKFTALEVSSLINVCKHQPGLVANLVANQGKDLDVLVALKADLEKEEFQQVAELYQNVDSKTFQNFVDVYKQNPEDLKEILRKVTNPSKALTSALVASSSDNKDAKPLLEKLHSAIIGSMSNTNESFETSVARKLDKFLSLETFDPDVENKIKAVSLVLCPSDFDMFLQLKDDMTSEEFSDATSLYCSHPKEISKILESSGHNKEVLENLVSVTSSLKPQQKEQFFELSEKIGGESFLKVVDSLKNESGEQNVKRSTLESSENGRLEDFLQLTSLIEPRKTEKLINLYTSLEPDAFKKLVQIGKDNPDALSVILQKDSIKSEDFAILAELKNALTPNEFSAVASLYSSLDQTEFSKLLENLKLNPAEVKKFLNSADFRSLNFSNFGEIEKFMDKDSEKGEKDVQPTAELLSPSNYKQQTMTEITEDAAQKMSVTDKLNSQLKEKLQQLSSKYSPSEFDCIVELSKTLEPKNFDCLLTTAIDHPKTVRKLIDTSNSDSSKSIEALTQMLSDSFSENKEAILRLLETSNEPEKLVTMLEGLSSETPQNKELVRSVVESMQSADSTKELDQTVEILAQMNGKEVEKLLNSTTETKGQIGVTDICAKLHNKQKICNLIELPPEEASHLMKLYATNPGISERLFEKDWFDPSLVSEVLELHGKLTPKQFERLENIALQATCSEDFLELLALRQSSPEDFKSLVLAGDSPLLSNGLDEQDVTLTFIQSSANKLLNAAAELGIDSNTFEDFSNLSSEATAADLDKLISMKADLKPQEFAKLMNLSSVYAKEMAKVLHSPEINASSISSTLNIVQELDGSELEKLMSLVDKVDAEKQGKLNKLLSKLAEEDEKSGSDAYFVESFLRMFDENQSPSEVNKTVESLAALDAKTIGQLIEKSKNCKETLPQLCSKFTGAEMLTNLSSLDPQITEQLLDISENSQDLAKLLLENEHFDANTIEQCASLSETLAPEQLAKLVALSKTEDITQLLHLQHTNPEEFQALLEGNSGSSPGQVEFQSFVASTEEGLQYTIGSDPEIKDMVESFSVYASAYDLDKLLLLQQEMDPDRFSTVLQLCGEYPEEMSKVLRSSGDEDFALMESFVEGAEKLDDKQLASLMKVVHESSQETIEIVLPKIFSVLENSASKADVQLASTPECLLNSFISHNNNKICHAVSNAVEDLNQDTLDALLQLETDHEISFQNLCEKFVSPPKLERISLLPPQTIKQLLQMEKSNPDIVQTLIDLDPFNSEDVVDYVNLYDSLPEETIADLKNMSKNLTPNSLRDLINLHEKSPEKFSALISPNQRRNSDNKIAGVDGEKIIEAFGSISPGEMETLCKIAKSGNLNKFLQIGASVPETLSLLEQISNAFEEHEVFEKFARLVNNDTQLLNEFVELSEELKPGQLKEALGQKYQHPGGSEVVSEDILVLNEQGTLESSAGGMDQELENFNKLLRDDLEQKTKENEELKAQLQELNKSLNTASQPPQAMPAAPHRPVDKDALKEQERHSLADEMMDLMLMAKSTHALFQLIGKEPQFDLDSLKQKITSMDKAARDAEERKQLWTVISSLGEVKTKLESQIKELQCTLDESVDSLQDTQQRNETLEQALKELRLKVEKGQQTESKLAITINKVDQLTKENKELQDKLLEMQNLQRENKKVQDKVSELEKQLDENELRRQLDKLYWVNKELLQQIKERDVQTNRLKLDFRELQQEDMNKNRQLESLDHHRKEHNLQKELLQCSKRELDDANRRKHRYQEERDMELGQLRKEVNRLNEELGERSFQLDQKEKTAEELRHYLEALKEKSQLTKLLQKDIDRLKQDLKNKEVELHREKCEKEALTKRQKVLHREIEAANEHLKSELGLITSSSLKMKQALKSKETELEKTKQLLKQTTESAKVMEKKIDGLEYYVAESLKLKKSAKMFRRDESSHQNGLAD